MSSMALKMDMSSNIFELAIKALVYFFARQNVQQVFIAVPVSLYITGPTQIKLNSSNPNLLNPQSFPTSVSVSLGKHTGLHTQKAYTHTGTSSPQIVMLSAHAYMHFA